jgi:thiol-disulfide isomerase/thioredoxin
MAGPLSAFDSATVWINSEPLMADALRGRVVLVDFWTYSCVNWLRTLPYVRSWHERYRAHDLVVVGAHAPEFGFEHDLANVQQAVRGLDVPYPVVIDNDFAIWRAFQNHYWPALYLLDRDGDVRFHQFGEGSYEEIELAIQELLGVDGELVSVDTGGLSEAADWAALESPETYLGRARSERRTQLAAAELGLNDWTLTGEWLVGAEAAALETAPGSLAYRFRARDLNLVVTPPVSGEPVRFSLRLDGEPPGDDHGLDVDAAGEGTIDEPRMYQLVRQNAAAQRVFEITFLDPGVEAYVLTFG